MIAVTDDVQSGESGNMSYVVRIRELEDYMHYDKRNDTAVVTNVSLSCFFLNNISNLILKNPKLHLTIRLLEL